MRNILYNLATDRYKGILAAVVKLPLLILSFFYYMIIKAMVFVSGLKVQRLDCDVISVGNITLGGTGKTTLVEYIALFLKAHGRKVAVLSRGYMRKKKKGEVAGSVSLQVMGDEPYMLSKKLNGIPVLVGADRIWLGQDAIRDYGADTVILDDGFQQWRISKDLEIVAVDAQNPFGNGWLIPRGILREGLSALRRADVFVITKSGLAGARLAYTQETLRKINPRALIVESVHEAVGFYNMRDQQELMGKDLIRGKIVTLFSGIGDPVSFVELILGLGAKIGLSFEFADHHAYSKEDLEKIIGASRKKNIDTIITTEKDAARLEHMLPFSYHGRFLTLRIRLKITENEESFHNRLLNRRTF